jgi:shikimate dehydrogenase
MGTLRLLGQHISYSASPAMHTAAFAMLGLDHQYELADVEASELEAAVDALRDGGILGANVTVPHKAAVMDLLDAVDDVAADAGAVNTIVSRDGRLFGSNTDVAAIVDEIRRLRPAPQSVVVLGAGGAARAVQVALETVGAQAVTLVSPSGRGGAASWSELPRVIADADLLVNATPVGTNHDDSPVGSSILHRGLAVLDLVYRPSPTRMVHDARACGLEARAGAGVLLGQGWRSLETWLGVTIGEEVKRAMADALSAELGAGADV